MFQTNVNGKWDICKVYICGIQIHVYWTEYTLRTEALETDNSTLFDKVYILIILVIKFYWIRIFLVRTAFLLYVENIHVHVNCCCTDFVWFSSAIYCRLGGTEDDVKVIVAHPFFKSINWQDLVEKKVGFMDHCL